MKDFNTKEFLSELGKNNFVKACGIPFGYSAGFPIVYIENSKMLITVPFLKYKKNKDSNNLFGVIPFEYIITFAITQPKPVPAEFKDMIKAENQKFSIIPIHFENLRYSKKYENVDFGKVIDVFPNEKFKSLSKEESQKISNEIYECYDAMINAGFETGKIKSTDKMKLNDLLEDVLGAKTFEMYKNLK